MRTKNSIKNILTVIVPYFIIGILGFIKSKVFVTSFDDDIYSLNQLFFQILGYFSLAEAGFEVFIAQKYYKAFSEDDKEKINSIYGTSVIYFRRLGYFMLGASLIVMFIVPLLTKAKISSSYIMLIFIIFVLKNTIDYFMMCPRIVINSDQKAFKINLKVNMVRIIESISDITLAILGLNYLVILIPGIFIRIFMNLIINKVVYKEYPWLQRKNHAFEKTHIKGMSNLIYQRFAGILNSNTDIILISTFVNPVSVITYTSYTYITKFINDTIVVAAGSLTPSFANALHEKDDNKTYTIFNDLNIIFFFMASFFSIMLYFLLDNFVYLWMGEKYLLNTIGLLCMIYLMFDSICKRMITVVINAKGLYKETKSAVIVECILNFIISITLVNVIGLIGVLLGTIISSLLTTWWYNPKYIYEKTFKKNPLIFFKNYIFNIIVTLLIIFILKQIPLYDVSNFMTWIINSIIYGILSLAILIAIYFIFFKSFRNSIERIKFQFKR